MPALIPGYDCDVFISYSQQDEGADAFVTHLSNHLYEEYKKSFNRELSVACEDISLRGKVKRPNNGGRLKPVVLVPLVSNAYFNTDGGHWKNELELFKKEARQADSGIVIPLNGGRAAYRIVPVKIKEVEEDALADFNNTIGAEVPWVTWCYEASGELRTLLPGEKADALDYQTQIHKVAVAIEEAITGMRGAEIVDERDETYMRFQHLKREEALRQQPGFPVKKVLLATVIVAILALIYWFLNGRLT